MQGVASSFDKYDVARCRSSMGNLKKISIDNVAATHQRPPTTSPSTLVSFGIAIDRHLAERTYLINTAWWPVRSRRNFSAKL